MSLLSILMNRDGGHMAIARRPINTAVT